MFDVLSAERIKLARHKAAWWLVWLFPIGFTVVLLLMTGWELVRPQPEGAPETAASWIRDALFPWQAPASTLGRYLLGGFAAVAFGGEYGWNTWKLVAPHRNRVTLMAAKFLTVLGLIAVALLLTAVLTTVGVALNNILTEGGLPAGIVFGDLLRAHGKAALATALPVLLTVAYAAAGSVLTRSTLAGAIIGLVAVTAEALVLQFSPFIWREVVAALPGYHVANLQNWVIAGEAVSRPVRGGGVLSANWPASLGMYVAWTGGLVALTVGAFRRQDLN